MTAAERLGLDDHYEIVCHASGDRAEADTAEAALVAADTLARDHVAGRASRDLKRTRATLAIVVNGTHHGALTGLARAGYRATVNS